MDCGLAELEKDVRVSRMPLGGWGDSSPCTSGVDPKPLDGCRRLSLWLGEPGVGAVGVTCTLEVNREIG